MEEHFPQKCRECEVREHCLLRKVLSRSGQGDGVDRKPIRFRKGDSLIHQGFPCHGVYALARGVAKIFSTEENGNEMIFCLAKPGDLLGTCSLYGAKTNTKGVKAVEDVECCFMEKDEFMKGIQQWPDLMDGLLSNIGREVDRAEIRQAALIQMDVRQRVAVCLKELYQSHGEELEGEKRITLKLKREELASVVGIAPETVVRFLSEFKRNGIIEEKDRTIVLINMPALDQLARAETPQEQMR